MTPCTLDNKPPNLRLRAGLARAQVLGGGRVQAPAARSVHVNKPSHHQRQHVRCDGARLSCWSAHYNPLSPTQASLGRKSSEVDACKRQLRDAGRQQLLKQLFKSEAELQEERARCAELAGAFDPTPLIPTS